MRMEELQMLAPTTFPQTSQINLSLVAAKASSPSEKRKDHCKKQMIGREKRKDQVQMVLHSRKASQKDLPSILLWLKLHQMVHVIIIVIIFTIIIIMIAVIIIIIIIITVVDLSSSSSLYKKESSCGKYQPFSIDISRVTTSILFLQSFEIGTLIFTIPKGDQNILSQHPDICEFDKHRFRELK